MIVKLQWKSRKSTEAPFAVDVPDVFKQAFVMKKDSKRFPKPAAGDTRFSTLMPHRASSLLKPGHFRIVASRAM